MVIKRLTQFLGPDIHIVNSYMLRFFMKITIFNEIIAILYR